MRVARADVTIIEFSGRDTNIHNRKEYLHWVLAVETPVSSGYKAAIHTYCRWVLLSYKRHHLPDAALVPLRSNRLPARGGISTPYTRILPYPNSKPVLANISP